MKNYKFLTMLASTAFFMTVFNSNRACMYYVHQPEIPESAKKLRKF